MRYISRLVTGRGVGALYNRLAIVRGGGEWATGAVQKLFRVGFRVLVLETPCPTALRRSVALCEAVYDSEKTVEDLHCQRVENAVGIDRCHQNGLIPLLVDPLAECVSYLRPAVVVDAVPAGQGPGTHINMAPVVIGLGPDFRAGGNVHAVIETEPGHNLGRLYSSGHSLPCPDSPAGSHGQCTPRLIAAPTGGVIRNIKRIGSVVHPGEALFVIEQQFGTAPCHGLLRGLIHPGLMVETGMPVADIDPRTDIDVHAISAEARCVGGAVLEACLILLGRTE